MKISRYFTLKNFESLLVNKTLHFATLSNFFDKNEGLLNSAPTIKYLEEAQKRTYVHQNIWQQFNLEKVKTHHEANRADRKKIFASCWSELIQESHIHWNAFGESGKGVFVRSSVDKVQPSFDLEHLSDTTEEGVTSIRHSKVNYRSSNTLDLTWSNDIAFSKSDIFRAEEEVRFAIDLRDSNNRANSFLKTDTGILVGLKNLDFIDLVTIGYDYSPAEKLDIKNRFISFGLVADKIIFSDINV